MLTTDNSTDQPPAGQRNWQSQRYDAAANHPVSSFFNEPRAVASNRCHCADQLPVHVDVRHTGSVCRPQLLYQGFSS